MLSYHFHNEVANPIIHQLASITPEVLSQSQNLCKIKATEATWVTKMKETVLSS